MNEEADRISKRQVLLYGGPTIGLGYLLFFLQFYFLKYATDVLLLAPAAVGLTMTAAKLWDAVSDPLVGNWSDRTDTRFGRRRPWMVASLPLLFGSFVALWHPPAGLGPAGLLATALLALIAFYSAFTLYSVPHGSLGAELSPAPHERTRAFAARQASWTVGLFFAFAAIQVARNFSDPRAQTGSLAVATGAVAVALLAIPPLALAEPASHRGRGGKGLRSAWRDVLASRPARLLLLVWFIENLGVGVLGSIAPFVAEYVLRRPDLMGVLPGVYVLAGIVTLPLWVGAARRFGKHRTWLLAMLVGGVAFGVTFFLGEGNVVAMSAALAVAGAAMGCGGALSSAVLADVIDVDEEQTGERKEGTYTAALNFALKAGIAVSSGGTGVVLGWVGFVPNAEQSAETLFALRLLFAGLPAAGFSLGALAFLRFDLPRSRQVEA